MIHFFLKITVGIYIIIEQCFFNLGETQTELIMYHALF